MRKLIGVVMIIVLLCTVSAIKYTIPELISSEDFHAGKDTIVYWSDGKIQITGSKNREGEMRYSLRINGAYVIDGAVYAYQESGGFVHILFDEQICTVDLTTLSCSFSSLSLSNPDFLPDEYIYLR